MKMVKTSKKGLLLALCLFFTWACESSTEAPITKGDYNRAVSFLFENINNDEALNLRIEPYFLRDNSGLWYLEHEPGAKIFKRLTYDGYEVTELFDHEAIADQLSELLDDNVDPYNLPFNQLIQRVDLNFRVSIDGEEYLINIEDDTVVPDPESPMQSNEFEQVSPDGKWVAYTSQYNLYIRSTATGRSYQLSKEGKRHYEFGTWYGWYDKMEGEDGERPRRFSVNWSPDSKWIQTRVMDFRNAEKMYLLDWSKDELFKPKLLSYYRGSPGDVNMVKETAVFYNVETREEIFTELPVGTHVNGINFRWLDEPGQLLAGYMERGYQKAYVAHLDLNQNKLSPLIEEVSETNLDNFEFRRLEGEDLLVLASERSGWRQLYLYDLNTKVTTPLTDDGFYVDQILDYDKYQKRLFFLASGREQGRNPYFSHLYSVNIEDQRIQLLTPENAHHEIRLSQDNKHFWDNYSTFDTPTRTLLRSAADGSIVKEIANADISGLQAKGWEAPMAFESLGRDGQTPIYGALWKPSNFDPSRKYPVIDHSYTGPHTQMFPRSFRTVLSRNNQALAELGFVVVMIDGMGTAGRSKDFHNYSYKNMGKNLTEHVSAIKELGAQYSWIDSDRVGIFGHSAGGFDAGHALLEFPDFYKVAVSSSADHDFRMEKAWWPEMYMGWPVDSTYNEVSNITMAGNLKGKLLLVHGGLDDNVNPSASFKLAEALVKADKEFDLLILPSQRHGYRGEHSLYFRKKRWNYFVEHLAGKEPIWDINWKP